jgi:hypothetical protein
LDTATVNAVPVAVQMATMDIDGVRALVDGDGVFRIGKGGGRKGGEAPRKELGSRE